MISASDPVVIVLKTNDSLIGRTEALLFSFYCPISVLGNRPSSQMSFLEQFLQESSDQGRSREPLNTGRSESSAERKTTGGASTLSHGSIESDEPDQDTDVDNQITSVASSRSNMSETSVRINF